MFGHAVNFVATMFYKLIALSVPIAWMPEMARVQLVSPDHLRRAGLI